MTLNEAVTIRIKGILKERNMTQYRLEMNAGISHQTLVCIFNGKYKNCNLKTIVAIIRALGMTVSEFFNHPVFESEDLVID